MMIRSTGGCTLRSAAIIIRHNKQHPAMPRISVRRSFSSSSTPSSTLLWKNPIEWYSRKLDSHPLLTKCISAGLISSLGHMLSQRLMYDPDENNGEEFHMDWGQTGRFMILNVVFVAPVLHTWYNFLDKAVPGRHMIPVVKRVFCDEFIFTPAYIPVLMGLFWSMEGNAPDRISGMIRAEFWNIMIFDWSVFIPTQLVNFRFVPVKYQVLVINIVGVGWNTFVSWRARHQHQHQLQSNMSKDNGDDEDRKVHEAVNKADQLEVKTP